MKVHRLKTWRAPFEAVWLGAKLYEIRENDRGYETGDTLELAEFDHVAETFTGREVHAEVTYMTHGGQWGLPPNLCVLGILPFHWRKP